MSARPNIVLVMTDQQRGDCLGVEGHPVLQTPTMDALADQGVRFSRCYSTCPVCIPARRSLLSGQYPRTHGMVGYQEGVEWNPPATLPGVLRDHGYQTWLVGRSMHQHPVRKRFGYDDMVISGYASAAHPDGDYERWLAREAPAGSGGWFGGGVMHNDWTAHPWPLAEHLHFTNWTVERALEFLDRRDPSCPFFLTVSFIAPHPPLQPPAFYFDRYLRTGVPDPVIGDWAEPPPGVADGGQDRVAPMRVRLTGEAMRSARAAYYGLINHVDDQLRRLLNGITGVDSRTGGNTIVAFTSDHGEMLGDHYQWRKQRALEASARVPFLLRAPARFGLRPQSVVDQPCSLEDLMPTLLEMAGVPVPASVEGRSVLPLMRGEAVRWRHHLHVECAAEHQAVTDGREKFIWEPRTGRELFFDLTRDPAECHNLAGDAESAARVARWRECLVAELADRPEGFVRRGKLVAGRPYGALIPPRRGARAR